MKFSAGFLKFAISYLWPPYWGTAIKVDYLAKDFSSAKVSMKLRWFNRNYIGTHFGGSLYAMTDPFIMLLLMHQLGGKYRVLDKSAEIEYIAPGKGKVVAHFEVTPDELATIYAETANGGKYLHDFHIDVIEEASQTLVAKVTKKLYIRARK